MDKLTNEHIDYIIRDLTYRGIVLEGFRDEIVDHICSAVEARLSTGLRFIDAYHEVLRDFGHTGGLRQTQIQTLQQENHKTAIMLRNYLTIAFRNLAKHRFYTFINIFGLAIGVAACMIITLYVLHELSYDRHFANADRIYRVNTEILFNGNHHQLAVAPAPAAAALMRDYPEIESATRFRSWGSQLVRAEKSTENIRENRVIFADHNMLKVFPLRLISGNPETALKEPNSLLISASRAEKYFPNGDAVGQMMIVENERPYKVAGVFPDFPQATHFNFDIILSMEGLRESKLDEWLSNNFNTYVLLKEGASPKELEAKFPRMVETYVGPQVRAVFGMDFDMETFRNDGNKFEFTLMPLVDIHLHSDLTAELDANGDITYVYLFSAIALFILGIACINFMNLSTARSSNRAKEVGVRKALGSLRSHLVRQFLTESIMLSFFAFVLGIAIVYLAIPGFNTLAGRQLELPVGNINFIATLFVAALVVGLLAGVYPSIFLSAFKPVNVLKGKVALGMKSSFIRSALVVFQFVISIILIIGTITVQRQLTFIQNKKLGFNKDQVIVLHDTHVLGNQNEAFKQRILGNPAVTNVSTSGYLPISGFGRNDTTFWPEGTQSTQENLTSMQYWTIDYDYVETLGMKIIEGRNFSRDFPSDSSGVIVNESAVRKIGLTDPIGKRINTFDFSNGALDPTKTKTFTIIGVIEDFHFESLRENISPLCLELGNANWCMSFRFQSADTRAVIDLLEKNWKEMAPGQPFQYTFMDDAFGNMYSSEQRLGTIFAVFAGLAIVIACLGLFALTAFTAEQRTKEIGIRKVLGASVGSIVFLLSREFGKLIVIAFLVAAPVSWFAVNWWLESYTYKAHIGITIYLLAGVAAFLVAWLTMGYQSVKAALTNPVNSLKSE